MKVVDYFAGLGGFTLGAERAGAHVVHAINHWPVAVEYHRRNHPRVRHACEDLTRFNPGRLEDFDILVAGFACQGFGHAKGSENRRRTKVKRAPGELAAKWDDDLRDRAQTVGEFAGADCFALFTGRGIDGCDVWARCKVEEIVEPQTVAEMIG